MGKRRHQQFDETAYLNNASYKHYRRRLMELKLSMYEWKNLPDTCDERYLELALMFKGQAIFFKDENIGFLTLNCLANGSLNVYNIPTRRTAQGTGYTYPGLTNEDSVIIYNNYLRTPSIQDIDMYSRRLYNLDRIIDVNANAQKTPILIQCPNELRLSMEQVYKDFDGNMPAIFANNNLDLKNVSVLQTGAPYVADKIYALKNQYWNEAMTQLGISNVTFEKKERMFTREISAQQGAIVANRFSPLEMRQLACDQINKMFGLDIWCDYREEIIQDDLDEIGKSTVNENGWSKMNNSDEGGETNE